MEMKNKHAGRPSLCFIGPMAGNNSLTISTPGEFLAEHFRTAGYPVMAASICRNNFLRLLDICCTIIFQHRKMDILILSVYVGRSFVVEDIASGLARMLGIPIVMVLHNGLTPTFVSLYQGWSCRVLSRASLLAAPSIFLARALRPFGWQVRVIPNPLDVSLYPFRLRQQASPRLLWMRSFYPYYNPQMALRVLARLTLQYPDLSLVMAGKDKGLQDEIIRMAEDLGVSRNVRFPGFLDHSKKIHEFTEADVFINTNSVDNAPVSIMEAWAMGLPVVSTASGGIPDLIKEGETGFLVPEDDDQAMAQAIYKIIENSHIAQKLSIQGRKKAESFAWENILSQWETIFAEILNSENDQGTA
jgi:glycosyltransferase involved in cell wall biosynthesis